MIIHAFVDEALSHSGLTLPYQLKLLITCTQLVQLYVAIIFF